MSLVRESLSEGVLRITLNRPDKRNALSPELLLDLNAGLARAAKDDAVRSVLLEGEGSSFCSGGDIEAMRARRGKVEETKRVQEELFAPLVRGILLLEKPVVANVNGDAFGAGMMLVLASDYAVARPTARFGVSFVKIGLMPDTGGSWLMPKLLGLRAARELALAGETVTAERAKELGIISEIGDASIAEERARKFAVMPTRALGLAKRSLVLGTADTLDGALAREAALQALLFSTHDHAEGVDAFLEKRAPKFLGR